MLLGSDGGASHAVTVADGWIFDSNEQVALPLTQLALDYCTWDKVTRTTCVGFHSGYIFTDFRNRVANKKANDQQNMKKKKKKRKRKKKKTEKSEFT